MVSIITGKTHNNGISKLRLRNISENNTNNSNNNKNHNNNKNNNNDNNNNNKCRISNNANDNNHKKSKHNIIITRQYRTSV